jgi:hypothetical protein
VNTAQSIEPTRRDPVLVQAMELAEYVRAQGQQGSAAHEVEQGIWTRVLQLGLWAMQQFFAHAGDGDVGEQAVLPGGRTVRRLPELHVRPYHSVFGELAIERAVYGTRKDQRIEWVPLDARVQLPESKFSYLLQDWDQLLVVEEPYRGVSERLSRILGFSQSVDSLERMNRKMATSVPEFFDTRPVPAPDQEGAIAVASADGKGVPMRRCGAQRPIETHRPKRGPKADTKKMALLGTVYTVEPLLRTPEEVVASLFRDPNAAPSCEKPARPQPQNKRVRASLARSEEGTTQPAVEEIFGWMARELQARNPGSSKPLCVLFDGQESLWSSAEHYLPQENVTEILDLLHITPRLWKAAYLFHPEGSSRAMEFVRARVLGILQGKTAWVTYGLRWMGEYKKLRSKKKQELAKICNFFDKNQDRMRYDEYLESGYPIATGVIEGACRHLVKDRLERAGMRWVLEGAQSMLHLRSVHLSGLWDEFTAYRIQRETQRLYPHIPQGQPSEMPLAA